MACPDGLYALSHLGPHRDELLVGRCERGLDCGDLAQPALQFRFLKPVAEVGMDLVQPRHLGWVNPKEWAPDTRIFVLVRSSEVATAGSEGDFPQFEMGEELVPFGGGEVTIFVAGSARRRAMNARWWEITSSG